MFAQKAVEIDILCEILDFVEISTEGPARGCAGGVWSTEDKANPIEGVCSHIWKPMKNIDLCMGKSKFSQTLKEIDFPGEMLDFSENYFAHGYNTAELPPAPPPHPPSCGWMSAPL